MDNKAKKVVFTLGILFTITLFAVIFYGGPVSSGKDDKPAEDKKGVYKLDSGEVVYINEKKIEIPAFIANPNMPLELFACAEGGKEHETLVVFKCKPQNIQTALILFGLKEGKGPKVFGDPTKPTGDLVIITVEWQTKDKKTVSYRGEDLIIDVRTEKSWPRVGWSFTGSTFEDEIDGDTGKPTGRKIYMANATKTIIATYHDPSAILDNPTESGGFDEIYIPNKKILPENGTPAKVIIRVPDKKESEELKKTNEEFAKWEKEWIKKMEEERKKSEPPKDKDKTPPEKK